MTESEIKIRLDELRNHGVEHCAGHTDAPGSCGTCLRISELEKLLEQNKQEEIMKNSCNRHSDCDAADVVAKSKGYFSASHCHDECCEDCFGN